MKRRDDDSTRSTAPLFAVVLCLAAMLFTASHPTRAAVIEAWVQTYNGPGDSIDDPWGVVMDGSGNVLVTGYSYNGPPNYDLDYYTVKYAATTGAILWERRYNGPANSDDSAFAMVVDDVGNVIVTGRSSNGTNDDYYTAKYAAADGTLLWEQRYNGPANSVDEPHAVAVDSSGNVIVTGFSSSSAGEDEQRSRDYYTAKYAAGTGELLWEQRFNGSANSEDQALALAIDASDNVIVTGRSSNGTNDDYYTAKYAGTDGVLVWERRYDGPANGGDEAHAVAVDANGNAVVTGYSRYPNGSNSDCYTVKYAAADGAFLWENRYNGPADSDDGAVAVAIDSRGNAIVTGFSYNEHRNGDYYTAKYAAANGAPLWEIRYNGSSNENDEGMAVAVDLNDNVVVTGNSSGIGGNAYTAKYAASDGALLWERRHDGWVNGGDFGSHSLALSPNGLVAITGSVGDYVTVVYRETLPAISIEMISVGVRLSFPGVPLGSYKVERARSSAGPWDIIARPVASAGGLVEYIDTDRPPGMAFYRARSF